MESRPLRSTSFVVLVAEDDAVIRLNITDFLESAGHTVLPAQTAAEAVAQVESGTRPDFALLDIRLARNSDGISVARTLRERWGIPSIFVSGNLQGDILSEAIRTGPLSIIRKPFNEADLNRALDLARTVLLDDAPDGPLAPIPTERN